MTQAHIDDSEKYGGRSFGYLALVAAVALAAVVGYGGFVLYPRLAKPGAAGLELWLLALTAGIASFFSPCSFSLLVTLLARQPGGRAATRPALGQALRFAAALSLGAALFLILLGAGIAFGLAPLFSGITFISPAGRLIRLLTGLALLTLGWLQFTERPLRLAPINAAVQSLLAPQPRLRREKPTLSFGLYGFAYFLGGFG